MTTPAGWYDDGSGRQRWWDGTQWTEHYAPAAEAPAAEVSAIAEASQVPVIPEVPAVPDVPATPASEQAFTAPEQATPAPEQAFTAPEQAFTAPGATAATTPLPESLPPYAAAAQNYPAPAYGAPTYAQAPYAAAVPAPAPAALSILGLVGLGLAVLGTILSCIPVMAVMIIGWVVLFAGFVISIISLFLKGRKWPGITGLIVGVVGSVVALVVAIVFFTTLVLNTAIENLPSPNPIPTSTSEETPSDEPSDEPTDGSDAALRPTVEELEVGLATIIGMSTDDASAYTDAQVTCFAQAFYDSELDDSTLRAIADSDGTFEDPQVAGSFAEVFASSLGTCMFAE